MNSRRILAAIRPELRSTVSQAFAASDLVFASTLDEARKTLENFRLIICCLHFADGYMFELLQYARSNPATRELPFVCVETTDENLPHYLRKSIEIALATLGAAPLISIPAWQAELGEDGAARKLRQHVAALLD